MKDQIKSLIRKGMWMAIALFVLRCLISWKEIIEEFSTYDLFGYAGEAIGVAAILMFFYEKWLWKYDPSIKIPNFAGKYEGTLCSTFDGEERIVHLEIRQTLMSIEVFLNTEESSSRSVSSAVMEVLGEYELISTYLNEPKAVVRDRSGIHFGTAKYKLDGKEKLVGQYYTDRGTTGDMIFSKSEKSKDI